MLYGCLIQFPGPGPGEELGLQNRLKGWQKWGQLNIWGEVFTLGRQGSKPSMLQIIKYHCLIDASPVAAYEMGRDIWRKMVLQLTITVPWIALQMTTSPLNCLQISRAKFTQTTQRGAHVRFLPGIPQIKHVLLLILGQLYTFWNLHRHCTIISIVSGTMNLISDRHQLGKTDFAG